MRRAKKRRAYDAYPRALVRTLPELAPPAPEAEERAVLGSMMLFGESARKGAAILTPEDFYGSPHQAIFAAICTLVKDKRPADPSQVRARLGAKLNEAGGEQYLWELTSTDEAPPAPVLFRSTADLVREASALRQQLTAMCSYMQQPDPERRSELFRTLELSTANGFEVVDCDDLLQEKIEVDWLIDRMFPLGGLTMLAADPGMGKSWLVLSLCHAIANGFSTWLGRYKIRRRGGALYLDAETGRPGQKERLELLDLGAGVSRTQTPEVDAETDPWALEEEEGSQPEEQEGRPLGFIFEPPITLGPGIGVLESHIRERKARIVVLDSLSRLMPPGTSQNDNDDVTQALVPVGNLAKRTKCNITVVHHLRKEGIIPSALEDRIRGAGAIRDQADVVLLMVKGPGDTRIVHQTKWRLSPHREPSFRLAFAAGPDGRGTLLAWDGEARSAEEESQVEATHIIREIVGPEGMLRKEILTQVGDALESESGEKPTDRTIQKALTALVTQGVLSKRTEGKQVRYLLGKDEGSDVGSSFPLL